MKGSYILLIRLPEAQTMTIGSLSEVYFPQGYYAYVGSALSGVESRVNRHLNQNKRLHWHIDYLLPKASITEIIVSETNGKVECAIARALSAQFDSIPGFGSSDCQCLSHLFFAAEERQMKSAIIMTFELLAIPPKSMMLRSH